MSQLLRRIGPSCAVLGLVIWCCWPYFATQAPLLGGSEDKDLPRVARADLSPQVREPSRRDPFCPAPREDPTAGPSRPLLKQLSAMGSFLGKLRAGTQAASDPPPAKSPQDTPRANATARLNSLRLHATYTRGGQRLALINEQIYGEGDTIVTRSRALGRCQLSHVLHDRVILLMGGRTVVLAFPPLGSEAPQASPPPGPAVTPPSDRAAASTFVAPTPAT